MDYKGFLKVFLLIFFNNNILLTSSKPSLALQYFSPTVPPHNPLADWLSRRPIRRPLQNVDRKQCKPCTCGISNDERDQKIVGGQESDVYRYPWVALLKYDGIFYCGGTLISDRHVLTAAHCLRGFAARNITANFLIQDRSANKTGEEIIRKVKYGLLNSRFNYFTFDSDIAILLLEQTVPINHKIRPVCLPDNTNSIEYLKDENNETEIGTAIGWGTLNEGGLLSTTLQEVQIPVINNTECRNYLPVTNNMFCAGLPEGKKDSCQGDSGGPFMIKRGKRNIQTGIVSWGDGCGRPGRPGVYTLVSNYIPWIRRNTRDGCYC